MRGSRIQMTIIGFVMLLAGILGFPITYYSTELFDRVMGIALVILGIPFGILMIRQSLRGGTHPVVAALQSDPSQFTKLEVQGVRVQGMKSESAHVIIDVAGESHTVLCNKQAKHERLVRILLEAAPHLANH